jgi:hypothetical protein
VIELNAAWITSDRLDQTTRGIPAGITLADRHIGSFGWRPVDGSVSLPILTMRLDTCEANTAAFLKFAADAGVLLAPHTKIPMFPELGGVGVGSGYV